MRSFQGARDADVVLASFADTQEEFVYNPSTIFVESDIVPPLTVLFLPFSVGIHPTFSAGCRWMNGTLSCYDICKQSLHFFFLITSFGESTSNLHFPRYNITSSETRTTRNNETSSQPCASLLYLSRSFWPQSCACRHRRLSVLIRSSLLHTRRLPTVMRRNFPWPPSVART